MRKDTIADYIDKKVIDLTKYMSPTDIRKELSDKCDKFRKNVNIIDNATEEKIKDIKDSRERYLNYYIFYAEKRIKDLYEIEIRDIKGYSLNKKFKILILKETLSGNSNSYKKLKNV
jgi:hypothetical protein